MVRVLSRTEAYTRRVETVSQADAPALPTSEQGFELGDRHPWFGKTVTETERARVSDAAVELVMDWVDKNRGPHTQRVDATRMVRRLLDWLDTLAGRSYQDRWEAADPDSRPHGWCPDMQFGPARHAGARYAVNALILLGVIRPSHTWLFDNKQSRFWRDWTVLHDKALWDRYFAVAERERAPERKKWVGVQILIRICIACGLTNQHKPQRREHVLDVALLPPDRDVPQRPGRLRRPHQDEAANLLYSPG